MRPEQVIIEPVITEKSMGERALSRYVFKVHLKATKIDVARAAEKLFKVKVTAVNTSKVKSKQRMRGRFAGKLPQWKKAYITLSSGQKIEELEV